MKRNKRSFAVPLMSLTLLVAAILEGNRLIQGQEPTNDSPSQPEAQAASEDRLSQIEQQLRKLEWHNEMPNPKKDDIQDSSSRHHQVPAMPRRPFSVQRSPDRRGRGKLGSQPT